MLQNPHHYPWCHAPSLVHGCPARRGLNALARHLQPQAIQARERAQVGAIKGSIGHVEVFQMDGVGISIIGRPRPYPATTTPNPHPTPLHPQMRRAPNVVGLALPEAVSKLEAPGTATSRSLTSSGRRSRSHTTGMVSR